MSEARFCTAASAAFEMFSQPPLIYTQMVRKTVRTFPIMTDKHRVDYRLRRAGRCMGFFIFLLLFNTPSRLLGSDVSYPGDCAKQFLQAVRPTLDARAQGLRQLAQKVTEEKSLFLSDAAPLVTLNGVPPPTEILDKAHQIESLRSSLSSDAWNQILSLWSVYLIRQAKVFDYYDLEDYCGILDTLNSFKWDLGYLLIVPGAIHQIKTDPDQSICSSSILYLIPPIPVIHGTIGLVSDSLTFVPSLIFRYAHVKSWGKSKAQKRLQRAADAFSQAVEKLRNPFHA